MTAPDTRHDLRPKLSACIIAKDEEARLPGCLASVAFCDEVVVVDSGSSDDTVGIAREAGARVLMNAWRGFAVQRNVALDAATGDWVLELDADERIEPELARAIQLFLEDRSLTARHDIAVLPQTHQFLGRELSAAMQAPAYRARLFKKEAYRHNEARTVHEGLWPKGPAYPIDVGSMKHLLAATWEEALADARAYARLDAAQFSGAVTPSTVVKGVVVRPVAKAAYRLSVDAGWRDGWQGVVRIGLESAVDTLTWLHLARRGLRPGPVAHHGSTPEWHGAPKLVAVAVGRPAAAKALHWLQGAADADAEAVLVTGAHVPGTAGVRVRSVEGRGPLAFSRAVNAEHQARPLDGVYAAEPIAAASVRVSRAASVARFGTDMSPAAAVARLAASRTAT